MIVLDASVAIKLVVMEAGREEAIDVVSRERDVAAPDLLVSELANVAWQKLRAGQLTEAQLGRLSIVPTEVITNLVRSETLMSKAIELAVEIDHSAYDCFYLAVAIDFDCEVVTADRKFQRAANQKYGRHIRLL